MKTRSFEYEANRVCMRDDLNLIYTLSNLITTLTKIDCAQSGDLALMSAQVISNTANELVHHVFAMYKAKADCEQKAEDTQS